MTTTILETRKPQQERISPWPGFWAMVGKELKSNFYLAILVITIQAIWINSYTRIVTMFGLAANEPMSVIGVYYAWDLFNQFFTFSAPFIALWMGISQIVPEQPVNQWAFLIHRPLSRTAIFWAKATAGLLLYLLGTLTPLLALAIWESIPGHLAAPFDFHLLLGALINILSGVLFYFAVLMAVFRPGRWWVGNAIPLAFAIGAELFSHSQLGLSQSALVSLAAIIIIASAAQKAWHSPGSVHSPISYRKLCFGAMVYLGIITVLLPVAYLYRMAIHRFVHPSVSAPTMHPFLQYALTKEGQVAVFDMSSNYQLLGARPFDSSVLRHLPNERIFSLKDQLFPLQVSFKNPCTSYLKVNNDMHSMLKYIQPVDSGKPDEQWYYSRALHELVGYSTVSRRVIGLGGPDGFTDGTESGGFPPGMPQVVGTDGYFYLIAFPQRLFMVDFTKRLILPVNIPTNGSFLCGATSPNQASTSNTYVYLAINKSGIYRFSPFDKKIVFFKGAVTNYPAHWRYGIITNWNWLQVAFSPEGKKIFFWYGSHSGTQNELIYEYTTSGQFLKKIILPPLKEYEAPVSPEPLYSRLPSLLIAPFMVRSFFLEWHGFLLPFPIFYSAYWLKMRIMPMLLIGILSSFLAYLIARRCGYARYGTGAWIFGAFFLGLSGVLLMLALCNWPAREKCPNCRKKRVVTREHCEHCGAPWAASALDGTEIFEGGIML